LEDLDVSVFGQIKVRCKGRLPGAKFRKGRKFPFSELILKETLMEFPKIKTLLNKAHPHFKMRPNVYVCVCAGGGVIHNLLGTLKRLLKGRGAKF
jgi:hypothetical protein